MEDLKVGFLIVIIKKSKREDRDNEKIRMSIFIYLFSTNYTH